MSRASMDISASVDVSCLPAISRMHGGRSFIAALVISCHASHQLLCIGATHACCLLPEVLGLTTSERGSQASMMNDFEIAILSISEYEAKVLR